MPVKPIFITILIDSLHSPRLVFESYAYIIFQYGIILHNKKMFVKYLLFISANFFV